MKRLAPLLLVPALLAVSCSSSAPKQQPAEAQDIQQPKESDVNNPIYPFTLMRQGSVALQQAEYDRALKLFEEAARLQPKNATVYNMIGLCHFRKQEYPEALKAFTKALELVPTFSDARNNRGATYLAMGQNSLAEVDFLAVLADNTYPHHWEVYYNLGMTYLNRGRVAAAQDAFVKAVTSSTPVYGAYLRLAEIDEQLGNTDGAIRELEEARLKFPDRVEAPLALGRLLIRLGRKEEARKYLQEVIDGQPRSEMARQAEDLLKGL
jgi:tetratricopeptide (TPR) repeat protein